MSIEQVEVLVEEYSMEEVLRVLLPKILGDIGFEIYPFQCKEELLSRLSSRLKAYASWNPANWRVVVVVDQDDDDCVELKQRLEDLARHAGLLTKSRSATNYVVVNRVVVEELESWYFGDWRAVMEAYPRVDAHVPSKAKYRFPDAITGGTAEAFERVLRSAGYFKSGLRKIEAARAIAKYLDPSKNRSPSFQALRSVLVQLTDE